MAASDARLLQFPEHRIVEQLVFESEFLKALQRHDVVPGAVDMPAPARAK